MINKALAKDILEMARLDQRARRTGKEIAKVDKINTTRMKEVIKKFGWPTISLVGGRASHMAWLLVQHADSDVNFQNQCLSLIKQAARMGEASLGDVAYLMDRVLVNSGQPQIYGTQFYKDRAGKWMPRPVKNTAGLKARRKRVGLESFKIYQQKMSKSN